MPSRGKYIVIEGNDGTGKSTQVQQLRERLAKEGIESIEFHEPAGTPITNAIRDVIKNGNLPRDPETNLLLFTAARHEIWRNAEAALAAGKWVISARNYYSTLAYQGYAEGVDLDLIYETTKHFTSTRYMKPDFSIILTLDDATRNKRISQRNRQRFTGKDTFEGRGAKFQDKVNDAYGKIAAEYSIPTIDATSSVADLSGEIWQRIEHLL
jgi:dTMP kinase